MSDLSPISSTLVNIHEFKDLSNHTTLFFLLLFNAESKGILFEININTMSWLNI